MVENDLLFKQLKKLQYNIDDEELEEICEQIVFMQDGVRFVPALLAILEENPDHDFGSPGIIVSAIERFHEKGYEEHLIVSLNRKPTDHLVWMLNRLINGLANSGQHEEAEKYFDLMVKISMSATVSPNARDAAKFFLE